MAWRLVPKFFLLLIHATAITCEEGITASECPFLCACSAFEVTCSGSDVFPDGISEKVRKFHLVNSSVDAIPINAFTKLPHLQELKISGTTLVTIRACSFAELENITSITFNDVSIGVVEDNAFSNLKNIAQIEFASSRISALKSYAFHGVINVQSLRFSSTYIKEIHPFAFRKLQNIGEIKFENCTIDRFLGDAVSKVDDIQTFSIQKSHMNEWHCGTISTLTEKSAVVNISDVTFRCDCGIAWLLERFSNSSIFAVETGNKCREPSHTFMDMSLDTICPAASSRDRFCHKMFPSTPHTCRKAFDVPFKPDEKVEYPSYFTKQPSAVAPATTTDTKLLIIITLGLLLWGHR